MAFDTDCRLVVRARRRRPAQTPTSRRRPSTAPLRSILENPRVSVVDCVEVYLSRWPCLFSHTQEWLEIERAAHLHPKSNKRFEGRSWIAATVTGSGSRVRDTRDGVFLPADCYVRFFGKERQGWMRGMGELISGEMRLKLLVWCGRIF